MKYRCRHDIVADILTAVTEEGGLRVSGIALRANLPLNRAKPILEDLVSHGILVCNEASRLYQATSRAYEWLELYRLLRETYDSRATDP